MHNQYLYTDTALFEVSVLGTYTRNKRLTCEEMHSNGIIFIYTVDKFKETVYSEFLYTFKELQQIITDNERLIIDKKFMINNDRDMSWISYSYKLGNSGGNWLCISPNQFTVSSKGGGNAR